MIDLSSYTKAAIEQAMLGQVDNDLDKREGSLIQTAIGPVAWFLEGLYMTMNQIQENGSPFDAAGDALDYIVALRGLARKAATAAVREGTFDEPIPAGSQFKTINGEDSVVFTSGTLISNTGESYVYEMTCDTPGTIGNNYTGSILPVTAIAGLTSAYLGTILVEGTEEETDAALRARFFDTFGAQPYGGNIVEYRQAILAITGVGAVQVYPANYYNGGGTVLCSIVGSDFLPASSALVQTVQNAICPLTSNNGFGIAPIGAAVTITTATSLSLNMACTVEFAAGISGGAETYKEAIEEKIEEYIASVREAWGEMTQTHTISYNVSVYASRIIYAILSIPQVVNVSSLTINGSAGDLVLTETSALQQIPVVGTVVINEV